MVQGNRTIVAPKMSLSYSSAFSGYVWMEALLKKIVGFCPIRVRHMPFPR